MIRTCPRAARSLLAVSAAAALAAGCGGPSLPPQIAVPGDPTPLAKCQVAASQSSPLVTEWPATEKARLEGLLAHGGVAVRYSGCEMTLLDGCRLEGRYAFQRTTLSTDMLEIRNADELYAKLPLGATSLEGELSRSGRLSIRTTISGQMVFQGDPTRLPAGGTCAGATHVITAISIGAFKMLSGGAVGAGGGVELGGAGAGGKVSRAEAVLKQSGTPERCGEAIEGTAQPDCSSPIQVFLVPLPESSPAPAPQASAPPRGSEVPSPAMPPPQGEPVQQGPPVTQQNAVYVRLPAVPEGKWTLEERSGATLCQLPCSTWLARYRDYGIRRDDGESRIDLPALTRVPGIQAEVEFQPPRGSKVLGIVGIAVGGASVFGGLTLFLVGALEDMGPLPGVLLSTGGLGITTGGIIYTLYSRSNYKPVYRASAGDRGAPGPRVGVGPGGIVGAF